MLMRFNILKQFDRLTHAVTGKGYRRIKTFNLADHVGPDRENAIGYRRLLCRSLQVPFEKLTVAQQVHQGGVAVVDTSNTGRGADGRASAILGCDGLITALVGVPLMVLSADCPLILIYGPTRNVLAVLHASWRALVDRIVPNAVGLFDEHFNCDRADLFAGISPAAGPCCYEVRDQFCEAIVTQTRFGRFIFRDGEKIRFDLRQACRSSLVESGLKPERIEITPYCTICDHRFFSYRRQGSETGRFALIAAIK